MDFARSEKIRPVELLYEIRMSASDILEIPFSEKIDHKSFKAYHRILAEWTYDCAKHVLPYFELKYPDDKRPVNALIELRRWLDGAIFNMQVIRAASLPAHAAAKVKDHPDASFAAHSAGQAVATAHVPTHAFGASVYAIRAVAAHTGKSEDGLVGERHRQLEKLSELANR